MAGKGLGAGTAKWGFLPYAHSDFIFAVIGEELGLVGAVAVVGLFVLLGVLGIRVALHAPDRFGLLLAAGVTAWFCMQAFVNIGVVIGILPVTGVPLPFVSAGGTSLVVGMVGAGLLLRSRGPPTGPSPPAARGSGAVTARHARRCFASSPAAGRAGTCSRRWPSPGPWWTGATPAPRSSWWAASGASSPGWSPPPASS